MRKTIFLILLFGNCSYAENQSQIDEKKLYEFIKKNLKNYQIFEKPIIKTKYKNLILVDFASAGAATNYTVILSYKNNKFEIVKVEKDKKQKDAIFIVGAGGAGRYSSDVKLSEKLKIYEYSIYGEENDYCKVEIYNFNGKFFVFNEKNSKIESKKYCKEVCEKISIESKACKL